MGFIYTAATPPGRARRGTAVSRTHEVVESVGILKGAAVLPPTHGAGGCLFTIEMRPDPSPLSGAVTLTLKSRIGRGDAAHPDLLTGGDVGRLTEDGGGHGSVSVALEL
jgi:hypothetical protein